MSRSTRPRASLPSPLRVRLLALVLHHHALDRVGRILRVPANLVRRAVIGKPLRPGQARAVAWSLRGDR